MDEERIAEILQILERENQIVRTHNYRAAKLNLPATLTLEEWVHILAHHKWECIYCGGQYEVLEHYIPLKEGGIEGTEKHNCVPACKSCNISKGSRQPQEWEKRKAEKEKAETEKNLALQTRLRASVEAFYIKYPNKKRPPNWD